MKKMMSCLLLIATISCQSNKTNPEIEKQNINTILDNWHLAAANADFNNYFKSMSDKSIFIGTDATENWNKEDFMVWSKPYFDKGKAWSFTSLERHIYFDQSGNTAWFDELLNTQMKICRGSGVMVKDGDDWKISQYVLSMTIPNDLSDTIVSIKAPIEESLIKGLEKK